MAAISSLVKVLQRDFPKLHFEASDDFRWSSEERTIFYDREADDAVGSLLHETAHGMLDHRGFDYDINLLKLEREAWTEATEVLGPKYGIEIDNDSVEAALDSYRDWLHRRSLCPACRQTGLQDKNGFYDCLVCHQRWRPNDARRCALRRYKTSSGN